MKIVFYLFLQLIIYLVEEEVFLEIVEEVFLEIVEEEVFLEIVEEEVFHQVKAAAIVEIINKKDDLIILRVVHRVQVINIKKKGFYLIYKS